MKPPLTPQRPHLFLSCHSQIHSTTSFVPLIHILTEAILRILLWTSFGLLTPRTQCNRSGARFNLGPHVSDTMNNFRKLRAHNKFEVYSVTVDANIFIPSRNRHIILLARPSSLIYNTFKKFNASLVPVTFYLTKSTSERQKISALC